MKPFLLLVPLLLGCDRGSLETVPVSGRITLNQGGWPTSGTLYFAPVEPAPGHPTKPGSAKFDQEGNFSARTKVDGDGLVPGKYIVNVECWVVEPSADPSAPPGQSAVPAKYQSSSSNGFAVDVPVGAERVDVNFEVKSER